MQSTFLLLTCLGLLAAHGQTVNVWVTTASQSKKMQPQSPVAFLQQAALEDNLIAVDETRKYQQVEGFGASMTDSAAWLLNRAATPAARSNAMHSLFSREGKGIGVSFIRNPMGASDLARFHYSYADLPAGQTDPSLTTFSIAHDQTDIIPLLLQARQLNPQLTIMASPWSPPGWMKTSGSMVGGELLPSMYQPYALYFVKYIQAYQALGIPIQYISLQNEPLYVPGNYPGMGMDAATQRVVLRDHILPGLQNAQLSTRVLIYDHNWDRSDYPDEVLSDSTLLASPLIAGTAWHGYGGTPGAMLTLANKYPSKGNYQTEHSGGMWVGDQVKSDFKEIIHVMRSSGRAYVKWSLALNENHGPNAGGCDTCNGLITIHSTTGALSYNIDFYTLGHFSKFVLPNAHRIFSTNGKGVISAAFQNPNGSKVLVTFNDSNNNTPFQVHWGNRSFSYTLPAYTGATFVWEGVQEGEFTPGATNQLQASSFHASVGLQTEQTSDAQGGFNLGFADTGDYAIYKTIQFGQGVTNVSARVASAGSGGVIELRYDEPGGPMIGSITLPVTGGWQDWLTVTGTVTGASGLRDLCVLFRGGSSIGNLNWLQFSGAIPATFALPVPWGTSDIGSVGWAGSAIHDSGTFRILGSGADIENSTDEFRYVWQPSAGICEIRARVLFVQNTHEWAKAGILIREDTSPGSRNAGIFVTPGRGVTFQRRLAASGNTATTVVGGISAPCWLRLTRTSSNLFTAYYSADGVDWAVLGSSTIAMSETSLVGMAVSAHTDSAVCAATFAEVSVNHPPVLEPVDDQTLVGGQILAIANPGSDRDVPLQNLAYHLVSGPEGFTLDDTGILSWRPTIAQSPGIYPVLIYVSDNGVPAMSATQSFAVTVKKPAAPLFSLPTLDNGRPSLQFTGSPGPDYTIESSSNLVSWTPLVTLSPAEMPCSWSDTNDLAGVSRRFYRAVAGP